ncbi:hypothetical protein LTR85_009955 [Meristemomyces frigidus]|nr:hypothetical protein LTR85_009955 [Meristemomyces frigidus]
MRYDWQKEGDEETPNTILKSGRKGAHNGLAMQLSVDSLPEVLRVQGMVVRMVYGQATRCLLDFERYDFEEIAEETWEFWNVRKNKRGPMGEDYHHKLDGFACVVVAGSNLGGEDCTQDKTFKDSTSDLRQVP